jgi:hypothetical protein
VDDELDEVCREESWPKTCGRCGTVYTEAQWENLPYVGVQRSGMDDYPDLELRNCGRCSGTMAITVPQDFA